MIKRHEGFLNQCESTQLWIIGNIPPVLQSLERGYLSGQQVNIEHGAPTEQLEAESGRCFVIVEPLYIDNKYVSISQIWKRFLAVNLPCTKLIVMGFLNFRSGNYIDLLTPPGNLRAFIDAARPASGKYELPVDGYDARISLARIFEGHGGPGLMAKAIALKQTLGVACQIIRQEPERSGEIWQELVEPIGKRDAGDMLGAWDRVMTKYEDYFTYMPFRGRLSEADILLREAAGVAHCHSLEEFVGGCNNYEHALKGAFVLLEEIKSYCGIELDDSVQ